LEGPRRGLLFTLSRVRERVANAVGVSRERALLPRIKEALSRPILAALGSSNLSRKRERGKKDAAI
jgi:hypothetical protein